MSARGLRQAPAGNAARGVAMMLLGVLLFAVNDTLGKWLVGTYAVGQLMLVRSVAGLVAMAPSISRAGPGAFRQVSRPGLQLVRMMLSTLESSLFFWALTELPLAEVMTYYMAGPIYVTALSPFLLGERVGWRRWAGIALGFVGALLVLQPQLRPGDGTLIGPLLACGAGTVAMTFGTIWQKRTASTADLRTNAAAQFMGAAAVTIPVAALTEAGQFDMSWQAWTGLAWAVCGLSLGAISLLLILIKRGAVARVASLFYLVPPVVAVLAFVLFGEQLTVWQGVGMAVAAAGVAVASRG